MVSDVGDGELDDAQWGAGGFEDKGTRLIDGDALGGERVAVHWLSCSAGCLGSFIQLAD